MQPEPGGNMLWNEMSIKGKGTVVIKTGATWCGMVWVTKRWVHVEGVRHIGTRSIVEDERRTFYMSQVKDVRIHEQLPYCPVG